MELINFGIIESVSKFLRLVFHVGLFCLCWFWLIDGNWGFSKEYGKVLGHILNNVQYLNIKKPLKFEFFITVIIKKLILTNF